MIRIRTRGRLPALLTNGAREKALVDGIVKFDAHFGGLGQARGVGPWGWTDWARPD